MALGDWLASLRGSFSSLRPARRRTRLRRRLSARIRPLAAEVLEGRTLLSGTPYFTMSPTLPASVNTMQDVWLSAGASDTDPADYVAYTVNWGDGNQFTGSYMGNGSIYTNHQYMVSGNYNVSVMLDNGQGGVASWNSQLLVAAPNTAPTLSVSPPSSTTLNTNEMFTLTGTTSDPDPGDQVAYTVNWGDGTSPSTGSGAISATHSYTTAGAYTISVSAQDSHGAAAASWSSNSLQVVAPNAAPTFSSPTLPSSVDMLQTVSLSFPASDPDPSDTVSYSVNWGDGYTSSGSFSGSTQLNPSHAYLVPGWYTVSISLADDHGHSAAQWSSSIQVNTPAPPPNSAPTLSVSQPPATAVNTQQAVSLAGTVNDSNAGDTLSYLLSWGDGTTASGSFTGSGAINAAHSYASAGVYAVSLTAQDNQGAQASAWSTTIVVADPPPTNRPPTAVADSYTLTGGAAFYASQSVLANDSDPDANPLTAQVLTQPAHGSLTLGSDGNFSYTPDSGYSGTDSFTYQASDGTLATSAQVTLVVSAAGGGSGGAPQVAAPNLTTRQNVALTGNLLTHASDPDGDPLTAAVAVAPQQGSVVIQANGSFVYTPDADYYGTDAFQFTVSDGTHQTVATALLTVQQNHAPTAVPDTFHVQRDDVLVVTSNAGLLGNDADADGDPFSATLVSDVEHGTLTFHADGSFSYFPDGDFEGEETFTYRISDGAATSAATTVTINVLGPTMPNASDSAYGVANDDELYVGNAAGVLASLSGAPSGTRVQLIDGPTHGTLYLTSGGSFHYVPNEGYVGEDTFTWQATDGTHHNDPATVTITVTAAPATPENLSPDEQYARSHARYVALIDFSDARAADEIAQQNKELSDREAESAAWLQTQRAQSAATYQAALATSQQQLDSALAASEATYTTELSAATAAYNASVATADAALAAGKATAAQALADRLAANTATGLLNDQAADDIYQDAIDGSEAAFNSALAAADAALAAAQAASLAAFEAAKNAAEATRTADLALADSNHAATLLAAQQQRDAILAQYPGTTFDRAQLALDPAVITAKAGADSQLEIDEQAAEDALNGRIEAAVIVLQDAVTPYINLYNNAIDAADDDFDDAKSAAEDRNADAVTAADNLQTARQNAADVAFNSAFGAAQTTYDQAIQTAEGAWNGAKQAAEAARGQARADADRDYNRDRALEDQGHNEEMARLRQVYDDAANPLNQAFQSALNGIDAAVASGESTADSDYFEALADLGQVSDPDFFATPSSSDGYMILSGLANHALDALLRDTRLTGGEIEAAARSILAGDDPDLSRGTVDQARFNYEMLSFAKDFAVSSSYFGAAVAQWLTDSDEAPSDPAAWTSWLETLALGSLRDYMMGETVWTIQNIKEGVEARVTYVESERPLAFARYTSQANKVLAGVTSGHDTAVTLAGQLAAARLPYETGINAEDTLYDLGVLALEVTRQRAYIAADKVYNDAIAEADKVFDDSAALSAKTFAYSVAAAGEVQHKAYADAASANMYATAAADQDLANDLAAAEQERIRAYGRANTQLVTNLSGPLGSFVSAIGSAVVQYQTDVNTAHEGHGAAIRMASRTVYFGTGGLDVSVVDAWDAYDASVDSADSARELARVVADVTAAVAMFGASSAEDIVDAMEQEARDNDVATRAVMDVATQATAARTRVERSADELVRSEYEIAAAERVHDGEEADLQYTRDLQAAVDSRTQQLANNVTAEDADRRDVNSDETNRQNTIYAAQTKGNTDVTDEVGKAKQSAIDRADTALTNITSEHRKVVARYSARALTDTVDAAKKIAHDHEMYFNGELQSMLNHGDMSNPVSRSIWNQRSLNLGSNLTSMFNTGLNQATNFFAGWADYMTGPGYGTLLNLTGGSHYIDPQSSAYAAGSKVGEIHLGMFVSAGLQAVAGAFSCGTIIGQIARVGLLHESLEALGAGIESGHRIIFNPREASGWDYLAVVLAVSAARNMNSAGGCFVVDTPVAVGWGESVALVTPDVPGPDDGWDMTWLTLGAGCIALVVTIKRRRSEDEQHDPGNKKPARERISTIPDDNYRLDPLFARWNDDADPVESNPFPIDPPEAVTSTEARNVSSIESPAAVPVDQDESYNTPERTAPVLPLPAISETTPARKRPQTPAKPARRAQGQLAQRLGDRLSPADVRPLPAPGAPAQSAHGSHRHRSRSDCSGRSSRLHADSPITDEADSGDRRWRTRDRIHARS